MLRNLVEDFQAKLRTIKVDTTFTYLISHTHIDKDTKQELINSFNFTIKINAYLDKITAYTINLSGIEKDCLDISIDGESIDERLAHMMKPNIAKLVKIRYDSNCNITGNLEPSFGTDLLLRIGMYLVISFFPQIEAFYLEDYSSRPCGISKRNYVNSGKYYLCLFGSTWYEGVYGAKLLNDRLRQNYNTLVEKLHSSEYKFSISFIQFKSFFLSGLDTTQKLDDINSLEDVYKLTTTFYEFFQYIKRAFNYDSKDNIKRERLCDFLAPWIHNFIDRLILNDGINYLQQTWYISRDNIKPIDINIIKQHSILHGGNRYKYSYEFLLD